MVARAGSVAQKYERTMVLTESSVDRPGRGRGPVREVRGPDGAPTLLLLHGLAATGRLNWGPVLPVLAEHYRVLVLDHRGHGDGIRTQHFRLADCADDAIAVADVLGIPSLIAVGYSMGGPIAKLCWSRHRDRVRGLVLCATANHFLRPEARGVASAVFPGVIVAARMMPQFFRDRMVEGMLRGVPPGERRELARRQLAASDPATVMQAARAVIRFSSRDWASNIDVPTAVVVTTRDQLVPTPRQYRLAASIPRATIHEVHADHLACVRNVDRFGPVLLAACHDVERRAASKDSGLGRVDAATA